MRRRRTHARVHAPTPPPPARSEHESTAGRARFAVDVPALSRSFVFEAESDAHRSAWIGTIRAIQALVLPDDRRRQAMEMGEDEERLREVAEYCTAHGQVRQSGREGARTRARIHTHTCAGPVLG